MPRSHRPAPKIPLQKPRKTLFRESPSVLSHRKNPTANPKVMPMRMSPRQIGKLRIHQAYRTAGKNRRSASALGRMGRRKPYQTASKTPRITAQPNRRAASAGGVNGTACEAGPRQDGVLRIKGRLHGRPPPFDHRPGRGFSGAVVLREPPKFPALCAGAPQFRRS